MGNKIGRKRQVVDEKYTRPQGLYQLRDIDHKKLRKLILDSKLAPCYPGDDEGCTLDLEECPICFLYFPSLNRSKCCTKGICTECFLQMKPSHSARPSQCPFCKTANYAVEYRGAKSKEEKGVEQVEEQRIIEAQIRMRQQELQDGKGKLRKEKESSSSSRSLPLAEVEYQDMPSGSHSARCFRYSTQDDEAVSSQGSCSVAISARPSHSIQNREDNFDLDLENMMIMQAIWQSMQEQEIQSSPSSCDINNLPIQPLFSDNCFNCNSTFSTNPSPSSNIPSTIPVLSEPHNICGSLSTLPANLPPISTMLPCITFPINNWNEDLEQSHRLPDPAQNRWMIADDGSNMIDPDMSYSESNIITDAVGMATQSMTSGDVTPENFEDQMMLTMAVSAAEAGARMNSLELMWL